MKLIESKTLASAAASIEFTSIPQTFTDLVILGSFRDSSGTDVAMSISFNGNTANFSARYFYANPAVGPASATLARYVGSTSDGSTANTFNSTSIYIPNYSGATNKSYSVDNVTENNGTNSNLNLIAGLWADTAAITSLAITPASGNWRIGTLVSLYGITKGSDGIVTTS